MKTIAKTLAMFFVHDAFRKNTVYLHFSQGWELFSQNFNSPLWEDLHLISYHHPLIYSSHSLGLFGFTAIHVPVKWFVHGHI